MYKPCLFAFALLLLPDAVGQAAGDGGSADKRMVDRLFTLVKGNASLVTRIAALDTLAGLKTKDKDALEALQLGFQDLLKTTPVIPDSTNLMLRHVVQGVGSLGSASREMIPDLVKLRGADSTLDRAVAAAVQAILKDSPPKTGKELQSDLKEALAALKSHPQDYVEALKAVLVDETSDVSVRVLAAKALGMAGKNATSALADLKKIAGNAAADEDLKSVAHNAIKKISAASPGS